MSHYTNKKEQLIVVHEEAARCSDSWSVIWKGLIGRLELHTIHLSTYGIDIPDDDSCVLWAGSQFAAVGGEATVPHLIAVVVEHLQRLTWKLLPTTREYNTDNWCFIQITNIDTNENKYTLLRRCP